MCFLVAFPGIIARIAPVSEDIARISSKPKGPGEQGAAGYCPKILLAKKGQKWCSVPSIGVIGKSALEIGQFLRRNFWMISGGPFLSRPLVLLLTELLGLRNRSRNPIISMVGLRIANHGFGRLRADLPGNEKVLLSQRGGA